MLARDFHEQLDRDSTGAFYEGSDCLVGVVSSSVIISVITVESNLNE